MPSFPKPDRRNLLAGLIFVCLSFSALALSFGYRLGSLRDMGPGYFPAMLSVLLLVLSVLLLISAFMPRSTTEAHEDDAGPAGAGRWNHPVWRAVTRPVWVISAAAILFALLLETAGLPIATMAMVLVVTLANRALTVLQSIALAVALAAGSVLVFVQGLGQQLSVYGTWFG